MLNASSINQRLPKLLRKIDCLYLAVHVQQLRFYNYKFSQAIFLLLRTRTVLCMTARLLHVRLLALKD